ncbi:class I SAM-dependent methyltransferase [Candidatus Woesearchaeota archaeon]|nr:class I SAM-dependent methyltransferase [Candidatus Woesearchaeota archaeon]
MKNQVLYKELAKHYDLVYHWKDYKKEADKIKKLISRYKKSDGKELLDVACGTGHHLSFFKNSFSCTGIDINNKMLKIAKKNAKKVVFRRANMINFSLNKKFDVILCLFSSIGYVKTYLNLKRTINNFARHLKQGGIVIIEPWFSKPKFKAGMPGMTTYDSKYIKIARLNDSKVKNNISILDMHYLIAEKNKGIKHFADRHELGLFDIKKTFNIMENFGFETKFLRGGLMKDRGIFIGIKSYLLS